MLFRNCLLAALLLAFLAPSPIRAAPAPDPGLTKALALARQALDQGRPAEAERLLESYRAHAPGVDHHLLFFALGLAVQAQDRPTEAAAFYQKALELEPGHAPSLINLGAALWATNEPLAAGRAWERAAGLADPGQARELTYQAAAAYQAAGQDKMARALALAGPGAEDDPRRLRLALGASLALGDATQALRLGRMLIRQSPDDAEVWRALAGLRAQERDYAGAATALETACALGEAAREDWRRLADLYQLAGAPLAAAQALERAASQRPEAGDLARLAALFHQAGAVSQALGYWRQAMEADPSGESGLALAAALLNLGRYAQAAQTLKSLTLAHPGLGRAWLMLGRAALLAGDTPLAQAALEKAAGFPEQAAAAADLGRALPLAWGRNAPTEGVKQD